MKDSRESGSITEGDTDSADQTRLTNDGDGQLSFGLQVESAVFRAIREAIRPRNREIRANGNTGEASAR